MLTIGIHLIKVDEGVPSNQLYCDLRVFFYIFTQFRKNESNVFRLYVYILGTVVVNGY